MEAAGGPLGCAQKVTPYLDTSSLVTLYVEEMGSQDVRHMVAEAALGREAGEFAEQYALRGFDALHLASFAEIARRADVTDTRFSSFDDRLNKAARDAVRRLSTGA
jgi:predicted nucleic acid-binding protein